jgi:hypothetical protein
VWTPYATPITVKSPVVGTFWFLQVGMAIAQPASDAFFHRQFTAEDGTFWLKGAIGGVY